MKLNFLGKGCAFYPLYGNTCAYFVHGKELYLLDCGESAFEQLYKRIDLNEIERAYVIVTHLHADHVGSLGTMISYFACVLQKPLYVIHPETTIVELLTLEGISKSFYEYHKLLPENAAGLSAEPVEVHHAEDMKCYGYLLRDAEECVFYSGDSARLPEKVQKLFLEGGVDRIYHDTSTKPSEHHGFYEVLEDAIPPEKRGQVYCMHLDGPCEEMLMERGFRIVEVEK